MANLIEAQGRRIVDWDGAVSIAHFSAMSLAGSKLDYALPEPTTKPISQDEIAETLAIVLGWGPAQGRYTSYFFMLPATLPFIDDNMAQLIGVVPHDAKPILAPMYPQFKNKGLGVQLQYIPALAPVKAFQGSNQKWAIFVTLSSFNAPQVPYHLAEVFEAAFTNGLVTRLVLARFIKAWGNASKIDQAAADKLDVDAVNPPFPIDVDFRSPATWGANDYETSLGTVLQRNSIEGPGILLGWTAASELLRERDPKYLDAVWKLLANRYRTRDLGIMTGYTLSYLVGYAQNERMKQLSKGGADLGRLQDPVQILPKFAQVTRSRLQEAVTDKNALRNSALTVTTALFDRLIGELYAASAVPNVPDRERLVSHYKAFLAGYQAGTQGAAEVLYYEVFGLGWGLGYADGFRDGYAKGYAEGYRAGYASGYAQSWNALTDALLGLGSIVNGANSFIDKAGSVVGGIISIAALF